VPFVAVTQVWKSYIYIILKTQYWFVHFHLLTILQGSVSPSASEAPSLSPTLSLSPTSTISPTANLCISIQSIQGEGLSSDLVDQTVTICGAYVTAVVFNGFYIQEIVPSESTVLASSGIFVYDPSSLKDTLAEGNEINITGDVVEYNGLTELSNVNVEGTTVLAGYHTFEPVTLSLPVANMAELERYEGMIVAINATPNNDLVVSEYYNFDRYGDIVVCSADESIGRIFQFTAKYPPNASLYAEHLTMLGGSCITIDDNQSTANPNPPLFGSIYGVDSSNYLRGGSIVTTLKGPLYMSTNFGPYWRVATLSNADLAYSTVSNPREAVPQVTGDVSISNTNLLNYFTTLGSRGANTAIEFTRQVSKTTTALSQINADVLGVQELENVAGNGAAEDLISRLNAAMPTRSYAAASIEGGYDLIGSDVIKCDLLFDTNKFRMLGSAMLTDANVDSVLLNKSTTGSIFTYSRVPLAVTLQSLANNELLTVAINHFKSKGSSGTGLDADLYDGAGNWNFLRTLSAQALLDWLATNP